MVVQHWNRRFGRETHMIVYFNESVANVLRDNMGMIIFDLGGCGGCYRLKTSYLGAHLAQRWVHQGLISSSIY